jgi:exonuclease SbcC
MKLKKLKLKNIRSYDEQEIEFSDGSLILAGDIGSGKTSILLAIEYVLFGLQPGQKGSSLLRNNCDSAEVSLEMEIDGKEVIIERRLRRATKGISNEYSAITINGQKTESSTTEIKSQIIKLLNYPTEFIKKNNLLYRYTIYTPQEQMKQIILEDADSRLNVLRHIFGIDKYKRIRENLAIFLTRLKEQSKLLQGLILDMDIEKQNLQLKKESLAKVYQDLVKSNEMVDIKKSDCKQIELEVTELESKIREKESFEKEVEKSKIMIATKKEYFITIGKDISEIETSISELKQKFDESLYKKTLSNLEEKQKEIEAINKRMIDLAGEIASYEKEKRDYLDKKERVFGMKFCPTCLQDVAIAHKHNIILSAESRISEINHTLILLASEKKNVETNLERAKKERINLEEIKLDLDILKSKQFYQEKSIKKLEDLRKSKETLEKDISFLVNHVEALKASILSFTKFDNYYKSKQLELRSAFSKEKEAEISFAELKKESEFLKREISKLEEVIRIKEANKTKLSYLLELIDWLSNQYTSLIDFTERNVMIKLRNEFSSLFNKWFNMLVPESFEAQLDEKFTPIIIQSGIEMEYSFLSGGERTAVALAYRLALNQTINSILSQIKTREIVILDEPTEGFSEVQIDKMRDVLEELNVSQLIIVSHEQKMESFVDKVIRIKKENLLSRVFVQ